MLDRSLQNCEIVSNINMERKEDFEFLCNHIVLCIRTNNKPNRLYTNFVNTHTGNIKQKEKVDEREAPLRHAGFPEKEGHLANGQRDAINNLNFMKSGEFFSVKYANTDIKLSTIKSMVFNNLIQSALGSGPAPITVYAGNDETIKDLLAYMNMQDEGNTLCKRWLEGINTIATYVNDKYDAREFQAITKDGKGFITKKDEMVAIDDMKQKFMYNCFLLFDRNFTDLTTCRDLLQTRLVLLEDAKKRIIEASQNLNFDKSPQELKRKLDEDISKFTDRQNKLNARLNEWKEYFNSLPKGLKFLVKKKIQEKFEGFVQDEEKDIFSSDSTYEDVEKHYNDKIQTVKNGLDDYKKDKKYAFDVLDALDALKNLGIDIENKLTSLTLDEVNEILDSTVRYHQVWYALHYYECRWLMGEYSLKDVYKHLVTKDVIERRYRRLSMITPLLVMNFEDVPYNFFAYVSEDKPISPITDFMDLLILDNADTIPAGVGANVFFLAKQAVVFGKEEKLNDSVFDVSSKSCIVNID
ncbi:MAG TPA: hypothetical protein GXZ66_10585 [Clostridiaceae bacterium]|jgi:hypothetical protein|nr:hypothetical protein [Clostridiaceae bacterium]HOA31145.1 hypothetical protein [Clostridia bacterium]